MLTAQAASISSSGGCCNLANSGVASLPTVSHPKCSADQISPPTGHPRAAERTCVLTENSAVSASSWTVRILCRDDPGSWHNAAGSGGLAEQASVCCSTPQGATRPVARAERGRRRAMVMISAHGDIAHLFTGAHVPMCVSVRSRVSVH
eukprot:SAG31_NODE_1771_length_7309_cov_4.269626_1_plen_149_part_00